MAPIGDPDDVLRSLRRYVALMLGSPPWRVRIQRTRVEDDQRPVAVVEESAPVTTPFARSSRDQGDVQRATSYAVMAYPQLDDDPGGSRVEAGRVRSLLEAGFTRGLVTVDEIGDPPAPSVMVGGPFAFPVYDYEGIAVTGPDRAGPTDAYMHAMIDRDFNVRAVQDPLDELRFTVVANLRVAWWAPGRDDSGLAPLATAMPATWGGEVPAG